MKESEIYDLCGVKLVGQSEKQQFGGLETKILNLANAAATFYSTVQRSSFGPT